MKYEELKEMKEQAARGELWVDVRKMKVMTVEEMQAKAEAAASLTDEEILDTFEAVHFEAERMQISSVEYRKKVASGEARIVFRIRNAIEGELEDNRRHLGTAVGERRDNANDLVSVKGAIHSLRQRDNLTEENEMNLAIFEAEFAARTESASVEVNEASANIDNNVSEPATDNEPSAPAIDSEETISNSESDERVCEVQTDNGTKLRATFEVKQITDLCISHFFSGSSVVVNSAYPAELQPRNRESFMLRIQVSRMAQTLDPTLLTASVNVNQGAPIVRTDGVILNGNGRAMAVKLAYDLNNAASAAYKSYLIEHAEEWGLTGENVSAIDKPILVRVIDVDNSLIASIIHSTVGGSSLSVFETAKIDAEKITLRDFDEYEDSSAGDLTKPSNRGFIGKILWKIAAVNDRNRYWAANGFINADGIARVKRAIFALAYADDGLIGKMTEAADDDIRNVSKAFEQNAPPFARLALQQRAGIVHSYELAATLGSAVRRYEYVKSEGYATVERYFAMRPLFDEEPSEVKKIMCCFDANRRNTKWIANFLHNIIRVIEGQGTAQKTLIDGFEEYKTLTLGDVIDKAIKRVEETRNGGINLFDAGVGDEPKFERRVHTMTTLTIEELKNKAAAAPSLTDEQLLEAVEAAEFNRVSAINDQNDWGGENFDAVCETQLLLQDEIDRRADNGNEALRTAADNRIKNAKQVALIQSYSPADDGNSEKENARSAKPVKAVKQASEPVKPVKPVKRENVDRKAVKQTSAPTSEIGKPAFDFVEFTELTIDAKMSNADTETAMDMLETAAFEIELYGATKAKNYKAIVDKASTITKTLRGRLERLEVAVLTLGGEEAAIELVDAKTIHIAKGMAVAQLMNRIAQDAVYVRWDYSLGKYPYTIREHGLSIDHARVKEELAAAALPSGDAKIERGENSVKPSVSGNTERGETSVNNQDTMNVLECLDKRIGNLERVVVGIATEFTRTIASLNLTIASLNQQIAVLSDSLKSVNRVVVPNAQLIAECDALTQPELLRRYEIASFEKELFKDSNSKQAVATRTDAEAFAQEIYARVESLQKMIGSHTEQLNFERVAGKLDAAAQAGKCAAKLMMNQAKGNAHSDYIKSQKAAELSA